MSIQQTGPSEDHHGVLDRSETAVPGEPGAGLRYGSEPGSGDGDPHDPEAQLKAVARTRKKLLKARDEYLVAVFDAHDAGISPTTIAEAAHVTEGAIRQTVKRNR